MRARRIYSELLPYDVVGAPRTVRLLAEHRLALILAVRPWDLAALPRVARVLADGGVPLAIWPMVDDADGRWANAANVGAFTRLVEDALGAFPPGLPPSEVMLDLEPPFEDARALSHGARGVVRIARAAWSSVARRDAFTGARRGLADVVERVHARGIATSCAVWPLVALDAPRFVPFERLLGTPVEGVGTGRVSVMLYTSIFEGWSRGLVKRDAARRLLARLARRTRARWGAAASVSLGCVGTGALGDEPVYRGVRELADDVALAEGEGVDDLALFDLGGVLGRPDPEAWLGAFVGRRSPH